MSMNLRLRDFIRVKDCYFSVIGYEHKDGVKCLLRYVPDPNGDRLLNGVRYKKLSHREALTRFKEYIKDGIFVIPFNMIDEVYRPDERLPYICKVDEEVRRVAEFFSLPKMGVTGSRLIGLSGKDSDVDFVIYGKYWFDVGREKIKKGIERGVLWCDYEYVYKKRNVTLPFEVFKVHEERKFNKAILDDIRFDLLYVRDKEKSKIPEKKGKKVGERTIVAEVIDDSLIFDYPACYIIKHPEIKAVLSFTHTFVGQAFKGEIIEARGVVEEIDGEKYLIVGTMREVKDEYIVSLTLLENTKLLDEFKAWKS